MNPSRPLFALLLTPCLLVAAPALQADEIKGVGKEMGYRLFGEAKKNREILLQNSRPTEVEVYDEGRGLFASVPGRSDVELGCRGKDRLLKVRFRDSFRESVPFQVRVDCGREIQFIDPAQFAVRPVQPTATEVAAEHVAGEETAAPIDAMGMTGQTP